MLPLLCLLSQKLEKLHSLVKMKVEPALYFRHRSYFHGRIRNILEVVCFKLVSGCGACMAELKYVASKLKEARDSRIELKEEAMIITVEDQRVAEHHRSDDSCDPLVTPYIQIISLNVS